MLAGFFAGNELAALVVTALATDAMRELALVAVRALGGADRGEEVVGAALGGTLLGVAAFGIRHCRFLSKLACASWLRCNTWPVLEKTRFI
jgi:hypothetical protein